MRLDKDFWMGVMIIGFFAALLLGPMFASMGKKKGSGKGPDSIGDWG